MGKYNEFAVPVYETRVHQVGTTSAHDRPEVSNQEDATEFCKEFLKEKNREHMVVLLLDHENHVIGVETVSIGSPTRSSIWVSGILLPALLKGAPRIIICHNHPLGEAHKITTEDVELTKLVQYACAVFEVDLLDHLVVDDKGGSFSIIHYLLNKDIMDQVLLDMGHTVE